MCGGGDYFKINLLKDYLGGVDFYRVLLDVQFNDCFFQEILMGLQFFWVYIWFYLQFFGFIFSMIVNFSNVVYRVDVY